MQVHTQSLSFYVKNKEGKSAVPFAMVQITYSTNQGTSNKLTSLSDLNGFISFPSSNSKEQILSILVKAYSFQDTIFSISTSSQSAVLNIFLTPNVTLLPEAIVKPTSPFPILITATINAINKNKQETIDSVLYTQLHYENNNAAREIISLLHIQHPQVNHEFHKPFNGKIYVDSMYRSIVKEWNGYEHGDHLIDLINQNPFRYANFLPSSTQETNAMNANILADTNNCYLMEVWLPDPSFTRNKLYLLTQIRKSDSTFQWIKIIKSKQETYESTDWKLLTSEMDMYFDEHGKMISIQLNYSHSVRKKDTPIYAWIVTESFNLKVLSSYINNKKTCTGFPYTGLYRSMYPVYSSAKKSFSELKPEGN